MGMWVWARVLAAIVIGAAVATAVVVVVIVVFVINSGLPPPGAGSDGRSVVLGSARSPAFL